MKEKVAISCTAEFNTALKSGAVAFILSLLLYFWAMAPALPPGFDSAELISACASGGIAHPPGYPLYTMLGWGLCSLNIAEPALTMNAFSACCSALTCGGIAFTATLLLDSAAAALVAALLFGFALSPWRMAVGAEVFSLHLLFLSFLIAAAAVYKLFPEHRFALICLISFVLGLSLSHHHTSILLVPGLVLYIYLCQKNGANFSRASSKTGLNSYIDSLIKPGVIAIICFLVGLLPYFWLILRAQYLTANADSSTAFNWGNPSNWKNFWWVISRSGYGSLQLSTKGDGASSSASLFYWGYSLAALQFKLPGIILGLFGLVMVWRKYRAEFWLWGLLLLLSGPCWALYAAQPDSLGYKEMMERFYCASYLAFSFFIAAGVVTFWQKFSSAFGKVFWGQAVILLALIWSLASNWIGASERGQYLVNDTIKCMADSIPDNGIAVMQNDAVCGGMLYAKTVWKRKFMVIPVGVCRSQWFIESLPEKYRLILQYQGLSAFLERAWRDGHPVYFDDEQTAGQCGLEYASRHNVVRCGLLFRYEMNGEHIYSSERQLDLFREQEFKKLQQAQKMCRSLELKNIEVRPFWHQFMFYRWERTYKVLHSSKLSRIEEFCLQAEKSKLR
ncbi:MAG: protein O-mannosyl-transferase family [Candidatus Bruticola sp.]